MNCLPCIVLLWNLGLPRKLFLIELNCDLQWAAEGDPGGVGSNCSVSVPGKKLSLDEISGKLFRPVFNVIYFYPVGYGLVMSYVSRVSALLVRKRENPEGLERGIDLADPLNLLKIHLVVFFGYSKYNGLININKEQDYVTKKVNSKNEKLWSSEYIILRQTWLLFQYLNKGVRLPER